MTPIMKTVIVRDAEPMRLLKKHRIEAAKTWFSARRGVTLSKPLIADLKVDLRRRLPRQAEEYGEQPHEASRGSKRDQTSSRSGLLVEPVIGA